MGWLHGAVGIWENGGMGELENEALYNKNIYNHIHVITYVRMYVCTYVRMYVCTYVTSYLTLSRVRLSRGPMKETFRELTKYCAIIKTSVSST